MDNENPKPLLRVGNNSKNFAKKPTTKTPNAEKGKYSMVNDVKSMKQPKITKSLVPVDLNQLAEEETKRDKVKKDAKSSAMNAKAEIIRSLNSNIFKETLAQSPALANAAVKTSWKRSDQEMMALLDGRELAKDEVRKIRLSEQQATVRFNSGCGFETDKELKKLFGAKIANSNLLSSGSASVSSNKLMELKKNTAPSPAAQNIIETAKNLKNTYYEKKNYGLSTMSSHRDIVRQLKQQKPDVVTSENDAEKDKDSESSNDSNNAEKSNTKSTSSEPKKPDMVVSDFLKKRIDEIRSTSLAAPKSRSPIVKPQLPKKQVESSSLEFELEIVIGESLTTKKLMDTAAGNETTKRKRDNEDDDDNDDGEPNSNQEQPNKKVKAK